MVLVGVVVLVVLVVVAISLQPVGDHLTALGCCGRLLASGLIRMRSSGFKGEEEVTSLVRRDNVMQQTHQHEPNKLNTWPKVPLSIADTCKLSEIS